MRNKVFKKFSSGLDYLTVRVNKQADFWQILCSEKEMFSEVKSESLPFRFKFEKKFSEFEILRILDMGGNSLGQVKIVTNPTNNRLNIFDELELQGSFFMAYPQYVFKILSLFEIDTKKTRLISRIDYRFDVLSSSTNISKFFTDYGKPLRLHRQKKCVTWGMMKTDRIELVFYDKILDIRENESKLGFVDDMGNNPYKAYIDSNQDITRIEYRKNSRALRESQRTLEEELTWVKNDALEYISKLGIHIRDEVEVARTYKRQEEMRKKRQEEIVSRSMAMVEAYVSKVDIHGQNEKLVRMLYERYGMELVRKMQDMHFERVILEGEKFAESINSAVWNRT